jgi:hypothetical protein
MEDLVNPGEPEKPEESLESLFSESGGSVPDDLLAVAGWIKEERACLVEAMPPEIALRQITLAAETARLAALEAASHPQADRAAAGSLVRRGARGAAAGVRGASAPAARPSSAGRWRQRRVLRPALVAGVALLLFIGGSSGLAVAANGAAPGDTLYGLDRAFEKIGIGRGGAVERLTEVEDLFDEGDIRGALIHAEDVIGTAEDGEDAASEAVQELEAAAQRVVGGVDDSSAEVRSGVDSLLQYLSENVGHVDGRQVAQLARNIGGADDEADDEAESSEGTTPDDPGEGSGGPPAGNPSGRP